MLDRLDTENKEIEQEEESKTEKMDEFIPVDCKTLTDSIPEQNSTEQLNNSVEDLIPFSAEDPVDIRRRRAIEAAERRRNQKS